MRARKTAILGLCALGLVLGLGAMAQRGAAAMNGLYLYCPPQPGVPEDFRKAACSALAGELARLRKTKPQLRDATAFTAENGLHIRLNLATKGRHFITGQLDWQHVTPGESPGMQSGPKIENSTMDQDTNVTSFILLGKSLARHGGLPE